MTNTTGARVVDLPRKGIEFLLPIRSQYSYNRSIFENGWNMSKQFMDLLFGGYRRQVLGLLLLRPDDSLYVRQIARLTGVPPGSLHRELLSLASVGILLREPAGNQVRYRANREHPIHAELAEIFRKTSGLADLLRDALAPLGDLITSAFVFGSMARGTAVASSDVDVCVMVMSPSRKSWVRSRRSVSDWAVSSIPSSCRLRNSAVSARAVIDSSVD